MRAPQILDFRSTTVSAFDLARILILADIVAISFSPALVNFLEFLLIIVVLGSKPLRTKIWEVCKCTMSLWFLFAFVGWVILATSWGDAPVGDRLHEVISWRKLLLFPVVLALGTDSFRKHMLVTISLTGVSFAVTVWLISVGIGWHGLYPLMRSDVVQTIYFALSALSLTVLLAVYGDSMHRFGKIAILIAISFLLVTVLNSTGRSGYLFLLVGCCCFSIFIIKTNRLIWIPAIVLSLLGCLVLFEAPFKEIKLGIDEVNAVIDPTQDPEISSMGVRVVMWDHTIQMIKNKPFLGSGAGSFEVDYKKVAESRSFGWRAERSSDPHQQYLHVAAEYGLVGLVLLGLFLMSLVYRVDLNWFTLFGFSVLAGFCATSFFNGHLSSLVEGRMFWILVPLYLVSRARGSLPSALEVVKK